MSWLDENIAKQAVKTFQQTQSMTKETFPCFLSFAVFKIISENSLVPLHQTWCHRMPGSSKIMNYVFKWDLITQNSTKSRYCFLYLLMQKQIYCRSRLESLIELFSWTSRLEHKQANLISFGRNMSLELSLSMQTTKTIFEIASANSVDAVRKS